MSAGPKPPSGFFAALLGAGAATAAIFALRPMHREALAPQGPGNRPPGALGGRPDPHHLGHSGGSRQQNTEHGDLEPASKRIIAGYGFWIFLLSDIIMFAAFFAAYAVLSQATAGGPSGKDLFDLTNTAIETGCLLLSSLTCGLASIGLRAKDGRWYYGAMAATFVLGAVFILLEVREFAAMIEAGNGPDRSAFLSAFFALVGLHGLHVTAGLLWLLTMVAQVWAKGYRADIGRRVMCFSLFWHALDIVWVALFSVVYLMGVQ